MPDPVTGEMSPYERAMAAAEAEALGQTPLPPPAAYPPAPPIISPGVTTRSEAPEPAAPPPGGGGTGGYGPASQPAWIAPTWMAGAPPGTGGYGPASPPAPVALMTETGTQVAQGIEALPGEPAWSPEIEAQRRAETAPGAAAPEAAPAAPYPAAGPESEVMARARAMMGDKGAALVAQLQAQGVPDAAIRARLGMGPAPAAGPRGVGVGVGMGMAPKAPELPGELQRPYETLYPADFASRVAAAAVAGEIPNEQAKRMIQDFEAWQKSPIGQQTAAQERARGVAEQAGELEQQRLSAQQQAAQSTQALLDQQRAEQEAQANEQRAWQADFDQEMATQTAAYEQSMAEARQARIDPNRARIPIVDALAVAMGEFARIMTGGSANVALQIINKRLDDDIAAQDRGIKTLEGDVAARRNRLGLLQKRFANREQAMAAEKRLQLEQVSTELNRIATTSEVEQNRVGAAKLKLALDDQIATMKEQEQMQHAVASQELANQRHMARMAAANQLAMQRQQAQQQAEMQASGMGPWQTKGLEKMHKKYIPGLGFVASEKQADAINAKLQRIDSASGALRELVAIGKKGGASLDPQMRARAQALATHAKMGMKDMYELGALSGPDMELMEQMVKDPAQVTDLSAVTRLEQTGAILQSERGRALRGVHATPGEMQTIVDPKTGSPKAAYRLALPGRGPTPAAPIPEMPVQAQ